MRILTRARADQRGFTLAELLVAIAIIGVIMIGILTLLMTGNQSYLTGANQAEAQAAVRAALERMTTDIRGAGYDPEGTGCTTGGADCWLAISNPTPTGFTIQSDWDNNAAWNNATGVITNTGGAPIQINYKIWDGAAFVDTPVNRGYQVTYAIDAQGNLTRQESNGVDAAPQTLLTGVVQASEGGVLQPFFEYLDADGNPIPNPGATPWQIRTVVVRMRAGVQNQPPAIWQAGLVQVTMSDRIRLRNR